MMLCKKNPQGAMGEANSQVLHLTTDPKLANSEAGRETERMTFFSPETSR